jgi:hypothetical protein
MASITRRVIPPPERKRVDVDPWRARALEAELLLKELRVATTEPPRVSGFDERRRVFDAWMDAFKKKRGVFKSGDKRDNAVRARLKSWSVDDLIKSIRGHSLDPWRHQQMSRHELATLLRTDGQVEAGLETHDDGGERAKAARSSGKPGRGLGNATVDFVHTGATNDSMQERPPRRKTVFGDGAVDTDIF